MAWASNTVRGIDKYEIRIFDKSGNQTEYVSSTAAQQRVVSMSFELARVGGCTEATIVAAKPGLPGVLNGHLVEIWVKPNSGTLTQYWKGEIVELPDTGTTALTHEYRAVGLWHQMETKIITTYYSGGAIDDLIDTTTTGLIDAEFSVDTDISSAKTEVSVASPYTIGDLEIENDYASKVLKMLAEVQKQVDYGVDQEGKVYFKDKDTTTVQDKYKVGKHMTTFEPIKRSDKIMNHLFVQSKEVVGGGLLTIFKEDTTSITAYGRRMRVDTIPNLRVGDDVHRLAEERIANEKDPRISLNADVGVFFIDFRFPTGVVEVTDLEGNVNTLQVQKVRYSVEPGRSFRGEYELGDEPMPSLEDELRELYSTIEIRTRSNVSHTKLAITQDNKWLRRAMLSARTAGHQNHFFDVFTNTKGIDSSRSKNVYINENRTFVGVDPTSTGSSIYRTFIIPAGKPPATVRFHANFDIRGEINFGYSDDILDFFEATNDWRIVDGEAGAQQFQNTSSYLKYKFGTGSLMTIGSNGLYRFGIKDLLSTDNTNYYMNIIQDGTHYIRVRMRDDGSRFEARVEYNDGGGLTVLSTFNTGTSQADFEIEVEVNSTSSSFRVWEDGASTPTHDSGAITLPAQSPTEYRFETFYDGSNHRALLDFVSFSGLGIAATLKVARDGDLGFLTGDTLAPHADDIAGNYDYTHDFNFGGPHTSGDQIILQAILGGYVRMNGWGCSWNHF